MRRPCDRRGAGSVGHRRTTHGDVRTSWSPADHLLQAYDARTGKPSWHGEQDQARNPRELTSFAVAAGVVVATFDGGDAYASQGPGDAASGTVVASARYRGKRYGVDARSGEVLWTRPTFGTQRDPGVRTSGPMALVPTGADRRGSALVGRDGRTVRAFPEAADADVFFVAGRPVVTYREAVAGHTEDPFGETYVHRPDEGREYRDVVAVVDRGSGKARRTAVAGAVGGRTWTAAAGRLYAVTTSLRPAGGSSLLPMGLVSVDVARGRTDLTPFPRSSLDVAPDISSTRTVTRVLGATGGRLLTVDQVEDEGGGDVTLSTMASYRTTGTRAPTELAGVPAADWPDACRLLPRGGGTHERGKPKRLGGVTLDREVCRDSRAAVRVVWVGRTSADAAALLEGSADRPSGADEVRDVASTDATLLRVGRVVVELTLSPGGRYRSSETERAVVRNLRAYR